MNNSTRLAALQQASLWSFALRFYALPDVEAAFLRLQDEEGVDVCEVLFHSWLFIHGLEANPQALAIERRERARWQRDITAVLRQLRQALKHEALTAGADSGVTELRNTIKKAELLAERENLQRWQAWGQWHQQATRLLPDKARSTQMLAEWLKLSATCSHFDIPCSSENITLPAIQNPWVTIASRLDPLIRAR
ncbi:TIGR02444 family protein [Halomonas sp. BLK-85]